MGDREKMMKTICVLFVIAAVACAMPTEKDVKELGESRDSGVKQLADSDAVETGNLLANGHYKIKGGKGGKWRCNEKTSGSGATEQFTIRHISGNFYWLKGGKDNKYCADEINAIKCNRNARQSWEKFTIESIRI